MSKAISKCILILALCSSITASGQSVGGKIIGRVVESETFQTLAAEISIAGRDHRSLFLKHARASVDGLFEISDLPAGELHLTTKLAGYATDHLSVSLDNGETRYVEFYLKKGKTIRGIIYDQFNKPLADARVNVTYLREATDVSSVTASYEWEREESLTDKQGNFEISNLHPEQEFIIEASHPKFLTTVSAPVKFRPQDKELSMNFTIRKGLSVSGVVRNADRNILQGARIMLFDPVNSDYSLLSHSANRMDGRRQILSNEDGSFSFDQIRPVKKVLVVLHPSYKPYRQIIDLSEWQSQLSIDVILERK
jgi:hypothetical protein